MWGSGLAKKSLPNLFKYTGFFIIRNTGHNQQTDTNTQPDYHEGEKKKYANGEAIQ